MAFISLCPKHFHYTSKTGSEEIKLMKLTISNKLVNYSVLSVFFSNKTPEYETYSTHLTVQTVCIVILTNTDYLGCIQFVGHLLAYGISKNSTLTLGSESKCRYKNDTFFNSLNLYMKYSTFFFCIFFFKKTCKFIHQALTWH